MAGWPGRLKLAVALVLLYSAVTAVARARTIYHAMHSPLALVLGQGAEEKVNR